MTSIPTIHPPYSSKSASAVAPNRSQTRFGSQDTFQDPAPKSTGASSEQPNPSKSGLKSLIQNIIGTVTNQGVFQGGRQAANVLKSGIDWNNTLSAANPKRPLEDRLLSITDLAYARFREGFQNADPNTKADASDLADPLTHQLYRQVLQKFPMLLVQSNTPLDLGERLVATASPSQKDSLDELVQELRSRYQNLDQAVDTTDLNDGDAKTAQQEALTQLQQDIEALLSP